MRTNIDQTNGTIALLILAAAQSYLDSAMAWQQRGKQLKVVSPHFKLGFSLIGIVSPLLRDIELELS